MKNLQQSSLTAPTSGLYDKIFSENEIQRKRKVLQISCLVLAVAAGVRALSGIIVPLAANRGLSVLDLIINFLTLGVLAVTYWLATRNHVRTAVWVLEIFGFISTSASYQHVGTGQPQFLIYLVLIVLAVLLLEIREVIVFSTVCISFILGLYLAENVLGIYTPAVRVVKSSAVTFEMLFIAVGIPLLVALLIISSRQQTNLLRQQNSQLLEALTEIREQTQANRQISQEVQTSAAHMQESANQQADSARQQVSGISQIATTIGELAATATQIDEMVARIKDLTDMTAAKSRMIEQTTRQARDQNDEGREVMYKALASLQQVAQLYQKLVTTHTDLVGKTVKGRRILDLMNSIAGETHLLALNASIEAAGAGSYGERFGVVAQEVKALAKRSNEAGREVAEIIQQIETATHHAAELAQDGLHTARNTHELTERTGELIETVQQVVSQSQAQANEINLAVADIVQQNTAIKMATGQQRTATSQVEVTLDNLTQFAEQNARNGILVSTTATQLQNVASRLVNNQNQEANL
jgi:methyl-accepting chemotaxis protein